MNTLTCVYCGMAYPEDMPTNGSQILTDHIKLCGKHPLRSAEEKIIKLRSALIGLVGAETKEELEQMELMVRTLSVPDTDKAVTINAIRALIETDE